MKASGIERTAVVGVGLMGSGIAQILAQAGCHVRLVDLSEELVERGLQRVKEGLAAFLQTGALSEDQSAQILSRLEGTASLEHALGDVQFVVEAVAENLDVKRELFERLDSLAPPEAILATNTSGLRVGDIAERTKHPERVVGSHLFYPPSIVPLVEVVRGERTSLETVETTVAFWKRCGKQVVVCWKDVNGFLVNRLQLALSREAMSMVAQGVASASEMDRALRLGVGIRLPLVGILEQRDWAGLDTHLATASSIFPTLEDAKAPLPIHSDKVARGETGVKAGKGFFDWTGMDVEAVRCKKQKQLIQLTRALREIMPAEEPLVDNG